MIDDAELLRRYAGEKSEPAFAELVQRHVNVVYAAALRRVGGDAHLAEEVAQTVFTTLARKAGSLADHPVLIGWLHRSTHYAALDALRDKRRREQRERVQTVETETMNANVPTNPSRGAEIDWDEVRPVIDTLLDQLNERDRGALLLRYFEGRSFSQVGAALRLTEDAARMRVERALEKLRVVLGRRGIRSTAAALGVALANQAAATAPAGIAASITGGALAAAVAPGAGGGALLAFITMSKIKVGVVGVILLAGLATVAVDVRANRELRAEVGALRTGGENPGVLAKENQRLNAALQKLGVDNPEAGELVRVRQRAAVLKARPPGVVDGEMISAANWRDVGRATPEAANLTFHWAMFTGDLDTVAKFVIFDDDTPENREAFMARFSPAVRAKYRTPERIMAAAAYGAGTDLKQSPDDAFQFLEVNDHVGGNGSRFGQKNVRVWYRTAARGEFGGSTRWQQTPDGWLPAAFTLAKEWEFTLPAFDPVSGDRRLPKTTGEGVPAKN